MAEVLKTTESGETAQLWVQFLMMQQQQALLALGRHPNPPPGAPPPNLALGRAFVDQLGMIREKTRGNLNANEKALLDTALGTLQTALAEATGGRA
jgi:ABC-type Fe3+ transport system substrate-binding protein